MGKPKVLLLGSIKFAHKAWESLSSTVEVISAQSSCREDFLTECRDGHLNGVVAIYRTSPSASITGLLDEELVNTLPMSVRFICHNGAGYDQIDIKACTVRSIQVSNTPSAVDDATADVAVFLLLGALRNFNEAIFSLRNNGWLGATPAGTDPQGKVLGILGMGGIGKALARRAQALGMTVQYHSRRQISPGIPNCQYVSFDELLRDSDVISLNLPLNEQTRHIISFDAISKMKTGVVIINTARGSILHEEALVHGLETGKVWSAGLDVFENEPKVHPGLIGNPRVLLLPHIGTYTLQTLQKMEEWAISNVQVAVETRRLKSPVPEQMVSRF